MSNIESEIHKYSAKVNATTYSMSVGELINVYTSQEIDLHPNFQRLFRWTDEQKSKYIESLLLGIPCPPFFVSERDDRKWDVIDGVQRMSTILEFIGVLRDQDDMLRPQLVLTKTRFLPSLGGLVWDNRQRPVGVVPENGGSSQSELPESLRIRFKRSRLDLIIINSTSDTITKYELFQRLNTGGSLATEQEVRNCMIIMANVGFYDWVASLAKYEPFLQCVPVSDRLLDQSWLMELVVRFIVLTQSTDEELKSINDLGEYLTDKIVEFAQNSEFDRASVGKCFHAVFEYLGQSLGEDSFKKYNDLKSKHSGAVLISLFEVVAIGLASRYYSAGNLPDTSAFVAWRKAVGNSPEMTKNTGSGVRASSRIPVTVSFGRSQLRSM